MRKKSFWLLEILIWFILLVGLINIGINVGENYLSARKTYNVTFKDVDGLIVGSPVRMMGIQVGHVIRVKPLGDSVDIVFVITNNTVDIPANSAINIQFTGLAGSKSLEIQPSKSHKSDGRFFNVTEPIRIDLIMNAQSDITKSVLDCSKIALSVLGHGGVQEIKKNIKQSKIATNNIDNTLDNSVKVLQSSKGEMISNSQAVKKFLNEETQAMNYINNEEFNHPSASKHIVLAVLNDVHNASKYIENGEFDSYADRTANNLTIMNHKINNIHNNIKYVKIQKPDYLNEIYNSFNKVTEGFSAASGFIEKSFKTENIHKLHEKTEILKKQTGKSEKNF